MTESVRVTIEEWANDCSMNITDKQVKELADAIEMCSEMEVGSRGFSVGYTVKSEEKLKIEELEKKLFTLECFLQQKGLCISYEVGRVTEHTMERISNSHCASNDKTTLINVGG